MRGLDVQELDVVAGGDDGPEMPVRPSGISQGDWDALLRQLEAQHKREQRER